MFLNYEVYEHHPYVLSVFYTYKPRCPSPKERRFTAPTFTCQEAALALNRSAHGARPVRAEPPSVPKRTQPADAICLLPGVQLRWPFPPFHMPHRVLGCRQPRALATCELFLKGDDAHHPRAVRARLLCTGRPRDNSFESQCQEVLFTKK